MRGIAANVLRNHFRRARRGRDGVSGRLRDPARQSADDERAERIAAALNTIPDRYEAVLRAKYLEGRSVADIAAESGDTAKAVESLLTRARQAFREAYGTEEDEHHA